MNDEPGLICRQVSADAILAIDTRCFEQNLYRYDERVANALLGGKHYQEPPQEYFNEIEEDTPGNG